MIEAYVPSGTTRSEENEILAMDREAIYLRTPIRLQNLLCSLEGWRVRRLRYGKSFDELLRRAEERSRWSHDKIVAYRDERLRSFVKHAYDSSRYYQRVFDDSGVDPCSVTTLDKLSRLPILDKSSVQDNLTSIVPLTNQLRRTLVMHTSGTTGAGLRFETTVEALQEWFASFWRQHRWHGLERGTWCAMFTGRSVVPLAQTTPPFWRTNLPGRQIFFSGYHLSESTAPFYIDKIRRTRPPWFHGYPSMLALMSAIVLDRGLDLGYRPRWITVGSENLLPHQARLIETAFGSRPVQGYSMTEAAASISECPLGRLHVNEDVAAVEFVPLENGSGFRVVGTNFTNLATPLIRYDVGDVVHLDDEDCDCGLPGRIVAQIDGRQEDYIVLSDGTRLGRMDHIFKDMVSVREAQIHQEYAGRAVARIVRNAGFGPADEALLRQEFAKRVGDRLSVEFEYLDSIPKTSAGKLRFVTSALGTGQLELNGSGSTGRLSNGT